MSDRPGTRPQAGVRVDFTKAGNPVNHGGAGTAYSSHGCRCDDCTAAHNTRIKRRRSERRNETPPVGSHGKPATYINWGCRCTPCSDAHSIKMREYTESLK